MKQKITAWLRKNLLFLLAIALSFGILGIFLSTESGLRNFRHALSRFHGIWLVWIAAGVLAGWLLESDVLHLFCRRLNREWTFGRSFYIGMTGLFYSAITPFNMGEPMEIYQMTRLGMDTGAASSIIAVKSLIHHAVTLVYSLVLISFELSYFQTRVSNFSFLTLFGLVTNGVFILSVLLVVFKEKAADTILNVIVRLLDRIGLHKASRKLYRFAQEQLLVFHRCTGLFGKSGFLYACAALLTLAQVTAASLISYFVYRSFGLKGVSAFTMIAADTFVTMVSSFVPLPGSSGGAEGGFYLFFQEFFGEMIVPGITLWRISTYYVNILFGCVVAYAGRRKYRA
jgi:uncharacterized protein (TIRG00374 family)